ncbi:MAG TPA: porin family protein [Flavobacteriaceae bacterium]|nr:porin family protein [Flavobacteriaceae bacterium]
MKKIIFALFFVSAISFAQDSGEFEFGASLGVNFANVSAGEESTDSKTGFNAGIQGEYYFSETWGLKSELRYNQKGWGNGFIMDEETGDIKTVDVDLNYVTLAVMANWHFGSTKRWYLNFGPYVGFLMSAEAGEIDFKEAMNTTDFGLSYAIGHKFPVGDSTKIFIEAGGQSGFSNISKETDGADSVNVKTVTGMLNVGVLFAL